MPGRVPGDPAVTGAHGGPLCSAAPKAPSRGLGEAGSPGAPRAAPNLPGSVGWNKTQASKGTHLRLNPGSDTHVLCGLGRVALLLRDIFPTLTRRLRLPPNRKKEMEQDSKVPGVVPGRYLMFSKQGLSLCFSGPSKAPVSELQLLSILKRRQIITKTWMDDAGLSVSQCFVTLSLLEPTACLACDQSLSLIYSPVTLTGSQHPDVSQGL